MIIKNEKPPFYEAITGVLKPTPTAIFAYGNIIYNPGNIQIPDHLMEHEKTHAKQQSHDETVAKLWWDRYLQDSAFRLEQEIEAYGAQYRYICMNTVKERNQRYKILNELATMLSSPMYGNIIGTFEAVRRIRTASGVDKLSGKPMSQVG